MLLFILENMSISATNLHFFQFPVSPINLHPFSQDFEQKRIKLRLFWPKRDQFRSFADFSGKYVLSSKNVEKRRFCLDSRTGMGPSELLSFNCSVAPCSHFWAIYRYQIAKFDKDRQ